MSVNCTCSTKRNELTAMHSEDCAIALMTAGFSPVRLCCGQRHPGPVCPDGKVMCSLCYGRFDVEELNVVSIDFEGQHEDVCKGCAEKEAEALRGRS